MTRTFLVWTCFAVAGASPVLAQTQTYVYTGADQTVTVPAGATSVTIKAWGAGGGGIPGSGGSGQGFVSSGGGGGFATGTLAVTPGQTLTLIVGQGGAVTGANRYGGGGGGSYYGGDGGGRSAVRTSAGVELITAGGGGGGGSSVSAAYTNNTDGGAGGGNTGADGAGAGGTYPGIAGKGGTQTAGGAAGSDATGSLAFPGYASTAGSQFLGGHPAGNYGGGGGGGGYYGGGGADYHTGAVLGGGGGGSSYVGGVTAGSTIGGTGSVPANTNDAAYAAGIGAGGTGATGGNGRIVLTWVVPQPVINAFSFTNQTGVGLSSAITSNTVTLSGGATSQTATCNAGCTAISINGGAFVAGPVAGVNSGDTIAIRLASSASYATAVTATVTVGATTSGTWSVTTMSAPAGGDLLWATSASGIYSVNFASVGIGVVNPLHKLHIVTSVAQDGIVVDAPLYPEVQFARSGAPKAFIGISGTAGGYFNTGSADALVLRSTDGPIHMGYSNTGDNPTLTLATTGNVGIGTVAPAAKLHIVGNVIVDGNIGARYQDVAEWVRTRHRLAAGTVVVIDAGEANFVEASHQSYDTAVVGVISRQPGIVLGEAGDDKVLVAQSGRVHVKVDASYGPVRAGDLLVTSPKPGVAMRSKPVNIGGTTFHRPGTLLGKALESLPSGQGEILVLLTLQ